MPWPPTARCLARRYLCLGDPRVAQAAHQTGGGERSAGSDGLDKQQLNHPDNASLLTSLLPALVVVRNQPRLATFVGLLKEEAQADCLGDPRVAQAAHQTGGGERSAGSDGLDKQQLNQPSMPWPPTARCLARRYLNALPA
jgi:hypothetical protein